MGREENGGQRAESDHEGPTVPWPPKATAGVSVSTEERSNGRSKERSTGRNGRTAARTFFNEIKRGRRERRAVREKTAAGGGREKRTRRVAGGGREKRTRRVAGVRREENEESGGPAGTEANEESGAKRGAAGE